MQNCLLIRTSYTTFAVVSLILVSTSVSSWAEPSPSNQSINRELTTNSDVIRIELIILKEADDLRSISISLGAGPSGSELSGKSGYITAEGIGVPVDTENTTPTQIAVGTFSQVVVFSESDS